MTAELRHGREITVGHNAVAQIMSELGIKGLPTRKMPKGARVGAVSSLDSRLVVGWSIDATQTTALVTNALGMATARRSRRDGLVIHSDRGVQFTSWAFSRKVHEAGIAPSMGAVGSAYDNAMVEACQGRLKTDPFAPVES